MTIRLSTRDENSQRAANLATAPRPARILNGGS